VPQIFISYAREDEARVRDLYARLRALGFHLWMDKVNLRVGQRWRQEIPRQLRASDMVLICFSCAAVAKVGYIRREFNLVLDILKEMPDELIYTLPVLLEPCEVPEQFEEINWCYLYDEDGFDRLVEGIRFGLTQRDLEVPTADQVLESSFTNTIGMEFVLIPAGIFLMGTPTEQLDAIASGHKDYRDWIKHETPQHQVEISRPFYLGKYPVTQAQWQAVMGDNTSHFKGDNLPVERVSWDDAQVFIKKLNEREGVDLYYLPSEAKWEYAARAGSTGLYSFGDEMSQLGEYAWYHENSGNQTHPVGEKNPNAWGLYDMHGNVWEWVQDWYADDYYQQSPGRDPQGPDTGAFRVIRGGSWDDPEQGARAASRGASPPDYRDVSFGFRCAMSVPRK
jgi:formylglycine-generating enzyme required for sulfatase activity